MPENFFPYNIQANDEYYFEWACEEGHLETAKWLIEFFPKVNTLEDNERNFRWVCGGGHLEIAKWLKKK